jgi:hypothetical protein
MAVASEQLQAIRYRRGHLELLDQVGLIDSWGCPLLSCFVGFFGNRLH